MANVGEMDEKFFLVAAAQRVDGVVGVLDWNDASIDWTETVTVTETGLWGLWRPWIRVAGGHQWGRSTSRRQYR